MKILYIDDNRLLIDRVKELLGDKYVVDFMCAGREGIERASAVYYNLILLDLGLPDINGLEVCRELRRLNVTSPILILTVQKDPASSVALLNCGADDYMTKPFSGDVLTARVAALLRRGKELHEEKIIGVGDLTVNITRRQVWRSGICIPLRRKEFDILEYLITNHGHALTREMILDHVWESGTEGWDNTINVHIKHLRDKIDRPFDKALIKTAYGIGYVLDDTP
jgi:DNA-binding response OmpR family regulator